MLCSALCVTFAGKISLVFLSLSLSVKLERLQGRLKYSSVQHYESGTAELLLCALCRLAELTEVSFEGCCFYFT